MTFGERLKELRERAGMTQAAAWQASGLPRKTYLNYEQGLVSERVPFAAVVALSQALGVDCTAFADCEMVARPDAEPEPPAPAEAPRPPAKGKRK